MSKEKIELILLASSMHEKIKPCGNCKTYSDCFTKLDDELLFWFDTEEGSTRMVKSSMIDSFNIK